MDKVAYRRMNAITIVVILILGIISMANIGVVRAQTAPPTPSCIQPPSGLVSWWPGDSNANDIADNNPGTLMNGATFAAGNVGQAFSFDGVNDYVTIPFNSNLAFTGTQSATIDAWINTPTPNTLMLIAGEPGGLQIHTLANGGLQFVWVVSGTFVFLATPGNTVPANTWIHVAGVYDSTTQNGSIFINGNLLVGPSSGTVFGSSLSGQPFQIGAFGPPSSVPLTSPFNGRIDEVEIYNRALTTSEIQSIFNAGSAGKCKPTPTAAPTFSSSTFVGGSGDQQGTGITIAGGAIYLSGVEQPYSASNQFFVVKYAIPPASSPVWSRSVSSGTGVMGVAATNEGVYAAGDSYALTNDPVGGKEGKAFLAKFSTDGTLGTGPGGSLWARGGPPVSGLPGPFFVYSGGEGFLAVTTIEGTSNFIYAVGHGQPGGCCDTFLIAKYDTSGNLLASATESSLGIAFNQFYSSTYKASLGQAITTLNGNIYSGGYSFYEDPTMRPVLWKHDPNLNQLWRQRDTSLAGYYRGVTAFGGAIYAVGATFTSASGEDYLMQKYDEAGNRIWSKSSGGSGSDVLTGVIGIGTKLYAVGYTRSSGSGGADAVVLEIDPTTGNTLSTTLFGGAQDDLANGAATGSDLYVVGESRSFAQGGNSIGQNDIVLLRYTISSSADTTTPVLTVPAPITTSATSSAGAAVTFSVTATDPDDAAGTPVCNPPSGSTFPIGTTTVTCSSTDTHGNTGSASFTITVQDTTPPTAAPTFSSSTFFGGSGDQNGKGISITDGAIYVVGEVGPLLASPSDKSIVVRYGIPPTSPVWSRSWQFGDLFGISAANDGVYAAGYSHPGSGSGTVDGVGDTEVKSILVKFSPDGSAGPGLGGSLWVARPNYFSYTGFEFFSAVTTAVEGNSTFIYATGFGQPCGLNWEGTITKYNTLGNTISSATDSVVGCSTIATNGESIAVLNGNIYVAGTQVSLGTPEPWRPVLWKYDQNLNSIFRQRTTDFTNSAGFTNFIQQGCGCVTSFGGFIYAVGFINNPSPAPTHTDYLIQKYDQAGNRIWSRTSGGTGNDVLSGVVGIGSKLFAVGRTTSSGAGGADVVILEIDPATGNTLSTTLFGGAQDDMANAAATDGTDLYVIGESRSFAQGGNSIGQNDIVLLRYTISSSADTTAPVLTVPATITTSATSSTGAAVTFSVTATDPDDAASTPVCNPSSGSTFPIGTTAVTCSSTDTHGNTGTASFTIKVQDITPPTITATRNPPPNGAGWNNGDVTVSFTCSDALSGVASCPSPVTVTTEGAGQSVSGTAIDNAGNTASVTVSNINIDKTPPMISATRTPDANSFGWNKADVTANFACADTLSGTASCTASSTFTTDIVNNISTDANPNLLTVRGRDRGGVSYIDVQVSVTVPPLTIIPYLGTGYKFKVVPFGAEAGFQQPSFDDSAFSMGDAAFGTLYNGCLLTNPTDVKTTWPQGTDILLRKQFNLPSGASNLKVSAAIDNDVQVFINGQDISGGLKIHEGCAARDSFVFAAPDRILNFGMKASATFHNEGASQSAIGTVTDKAGNTASTTVSGINIDKTPPSITTPSPITAEATSSSGATVSYPLPTSTDNVGVTSLTCTPPSGSTFPLGTTTVTCTASDAAGNTGSNSFTITIVDTTTPVITKPADVTKEATAAQTAATLGTATATDLVDGTVIVTNNATATYPVGVTKIQYTATDSHGNTATALQTVTITDTTPPDTSINSAVDGSPSAVINGGLTTSTSITFTFSGTDNVAVTSFQCSLDGALFSACTSPNSITPLTVGSHNFQVRAIDGAGNIDQTPASFSWQVVNLSTGLPGSSLTTNADGTTTITGSDTSGNNIIAITLPPGTSTTGGSVAVTTQTAGQNTAAQITGVSVPYPPGKSIQIKTNPGSNFVCIVDSPSSVLISGLPNCGSTDLSISQVVMACNGVTQTFSGFPNLPFDRSYTCTKSTVGTINYMKVDGLAFSFIMEGVRPTAKAGGPYQGNEGQAIALDGSKSTDLDGSIVTYQWDLDNNGQYNDATGATPNAVFDDNGSFTIGLKVTDNSGLSDTNKAQVTVLNVAPTVSVITAPLDPVQVGTSISVSASFTDPGILDTHTALFDWGDGTTSPGAITESKGSGTVTGNHIYNTPGIYTVTLTVTDKDGASAQSTFRFIVVYDPTGGFVTGGGWINSPPGAYAKDPSLTGKASFGFVSKYQKGATIPTGVTEFQFKVASLNFHSENYDWLVIAGAQAKYKGTGTINGAGNFGFMLSATDGQITGGGDIDKFRIKIWDKNNGDAIVYDNNMGSSDDAVPTTAISGGSIVIHK